MEQMAKELCASVCSENIAEAWRTGFAAGMAATFLFVVVVQLLMKINGGVRASKAKGQERD